MKNRKLMVRTQFNNQSKLYSYFTKLCMIQIQIHGVAMLHFVFLKQMTKTHNAKADSNPKVSNTHKKKTLWKGRNRVI